MKLFKCTNDRGTVTFIHPDSIIKIERLNTDYGSKSDIHLRHAMVTHVYDTRDPETLANQINDECYNIKLLKS